LKLTGDRLVVVAMAHTPQEADLPAVDAEARWLEERFPGTETLRGQQARRDWVLTMLQRRPVAHFACHGRADPDAPSESRLLLHDHRDRPLSVARLARAELPGAALAYLSACEAMVTTPELADESVHLTAACQLAGYPQVVGTLWKVDDATSARMTEMVYGSLADRDLMDLNVAAAVNEAIRSLRAVNAPASAWAPYVHVGA
jgi:CHAT domain-containing protein